MADNDLFAPPTQEELDRVNTPVLKAAPQDDLFAPPTEAELQGHSFKDKALELAKEALAMRTSFGSGVAKAATLGYFNPETQIPTVAKTVEQNPSSNIAGQAMGAAALGSVAPSVKFARSVPAVDAGKVAQYINTAVNIGKAGTAGGLTGAGYGFVAKPGLEANSVREDLQNRMGNAFLGGTTGALVGGGTGIFQEAGDFLGTKLAGLKGPLKDIYLQAKEQFKAMSAIIKGKPDERAAHEYAQNEVNKLVQAANSERLSNLAQKAKMLAGEKTLAVPSEALKPTGIPAVDSEITRLKALQGAPEQKVPLPAEEPSHYYLTRSQIHNLEQKARESTRFTPNSFGEIETAGKGKDLSYKMSQTLKGAGAENYDPLMDTMHEQASTYGQYAPKYIKKPTQIFSPQAQPELEKLDSVFGTDLAQQNRSYLAAKMAKNAPAQKTGLALLDYFGGPELKTGSNVSVPLAASFAEAFGKKKK